MIKRLYLVCLLTMMALYSYTEYNGKMADFLGANGNSDIHANNRESVYSSAFKWIRDYIPWEIIEANNDVYNYGGWPYLDAYYGKMNQNGVNILMCVEKGPTSIVFDPYFPYDNGDGYSEVNYRERAEFMAQVAARYGTKSDHPDSDLESSDNLQGLDYVRYFEDFNEPEQTWFTHQWPPAAYAAYVNAAHNGAGCTTDSSRPIIGIKQGDPNAVHVLGGLVGPAYSLDHLNAVATKGKPYDVLNFHVYF